MIDPTVPTSAAASAGVLELLRQFSDDQAAADRYAAACLERAKAVERRLRAFEYLAPDTARRPGPLSGIPVAIKDIIATSDMPTTNGSPIYRDHVPAADAWVVERLRNLGATIFGKTVSTEFAWRHPGPTLNPWNTRHTPGGSSSGSAAAVASGIVPLALGTQNSRFDHQTGGVQWSGRSQTEFRRHPSHRGASAQSIARSRRLVRPTGRRRRLCAFVACRFE